MSWSSIFQAVGSHIYWLSPPKATHLQRLHRASAFCSLNEVLSGQEGGRLQQHRWLCQHAWPCLQVLLAWSSTSTVVLFVLKIVEELDWRTSLLRGHLLSLQNCLYISQFHHSILNNGFLLSERAWEDTQYSCSDIAEKPAQGFWDSDTGLVQTLAHILPARDCWLLWSQSESSMPHTLHTCKESYFSGIFWKKKCEESHGDVENMKHN